MSSEPEPVVATVSELKPSMRNISIVFKILEMTEAREVTSREDGKTHKIVDAKVGDKTGTVIVPLWDDAIERVQVGSTYKLENGYTGLFRSNLRLNIGRYGVISAATEEIGDVDTSNDVSAVEHERQYRRGPSRGYGGPREDSDRGGYGGGGGYGGRGGGGYGGGRDRDRGRGGGGRSDRGRSGGGHRGYD
jgi:replication factor A1